MRPRSIRARTTLIASLIMALTLTTASLLLLKALEASVVESRDQAIRAEVRALAAQATSGRLDDPLPVGEDELAQVVAADGTVLARSEGLGDSAAVTSLAPKVGDLTVTMREGVPDDDEVETYRIWATSAETATGRVRVYVGTSPERVREAVAAAGDALVVGVPAVVVSLALLTFWLVGAALGPVDRIRAEVAAISTTDLARRVPEPDTGDEISRLARTMNEMLARLESGSAREREFVADASHELLSPLASLRAQLEVAAAVPTPPDHELLADLRADVLRMELLVRDLLMLARTEGLAGLGGELVDLDDLVLVEARRVERDASVTVDTRGVSAAPVRGRHDELARLVRNLLENAVAHADSRVEVTLTGGDETVELVVADDGPGVPPDLAPRVFERFVTGSTARRAGEGTGLGLAIARSVAVGHGGTLLLDDRPGGAVFRLRLPAG